MLAVIGNGVVIDPAALLEEIAGLEAAGIDVRSQLKISNRAHVIFPFHRTIEKISEGRDDRVPIGTTSRGIGPCYEDKIARRGIRIADLFDNDFASLYRALAEDKQLIAKAFKIPEPGDFEEILDALSAIRGADSTARLRHRSFAEQDDSRREKHLFEGAQGTMLDIDFGTYPFVTSSSAAAGWSLYGNWCSTEQNRRHYRCLQGLYHSGGRRALSRRKISPNWAKRSGGRKRVWLGYRTAAPLRLVRRSAAALYSRSERLRQSDHHQARRAG